IRARSTLGAIRNTASSRPNLLFGKRPGDLDRDLTNGPKWARLPRMADIPRGLAWGCHKITSDLADSRIGKPGFLSSSPSSDPECAGAEPGRSGRTPLEQRISSRRSTSESIERSTFTCCRRLKQEKGLRVTCDAFA